MRSSLAPPVELALAVYFAAGSMLVYHWLASWNGDLSPFVWKASADVILDKVRRCKELSKTGD